MRRTGAEGANPGPRRSLGINGRINLVVAISVLPLAALSVLTTVSSDAVRAAAEDASRRASGTNSVAAQVSATAVRIRELVGAFRV